MMHHRLFFLVAVSSLTLLFSCQQNAPKIDMDVEVPNFALLDQNGDFHELYYYGDEKAVVLYTQKNGCSTVRNDMDELKTVRSAYQEKGVQFLMINSTGKDSREEIKKEAEKYDIEFPVLEDKAQLAAEALQLYRSGEAIVLDPETWSVSYRGPVNQLAVALDAHLNGELLAENQINVKGTALPIKHTDKSAFENISYSLDVAPILKEKCIKCHVEGGIAPFAMKDHATVFGWSQMMREVLRTKRMPPWHADPHYGTFADDLSLTTEELQTLVHWIDAGALKGEDEADPLAEYRPEKKEWTLGEPDLIIQLNKEEVPATGVIDYRYQMFEVDLDYDVYATAIQVIPDNDEVLHHLLVSVVYPDGYMEPIDRRSPWLDGLFAAWAPGQNVEEFPENTGRVLPAGSKLHFQLHYTTNGKAQSDASTIGIYYTDKKPENEYLLAGAFKTDIELKPNSYYENSAKYRFDKEVTIYGLSPHMHYRGKEMKFVALYPDGKRETLLNVPNYSFNWQRTYRLAEPTTLPARTVIFVDAVFDNTSKNTFNPAPEKTVYWGDFSFDEMLIGYMSFQYGKPAGPDSKRISMK